MSTEESGDYFSRFTEAVSSTRKIKPRIKIELLLVVGTHTAILVSAGPKLKRLQPMLQPLRSKDAFQKRFMQFLLTDCFTPVYFLYTWVTHFSDIYLLLLKPKKNKKQRCIPEKMF